MPDPVRVVFVGSHASRGGSERVLELLVAGLGPGWTERVVLLADGPAVARLRALGAEVDVLAVGRRIGLLAGAARIRRRLRGAEVVHANGIKAALVCVLAAPRVPVVWVKHDLSWDGRLARLVASRCAEVIGVSATVVATLPAARTSVVANGVPDVAAAPADLGAAEVVLHVGRLHPAKGQHELLTAAADLLARRPSAHIVFAGDDDPSQAEYAARVRAQASTRVRFLGHRDDIDAVIAAADVLVVTSGPDERGMGREGFGLAAIEAFAAGTPVVAYGDGALPEVLGDAAVLVPPGARDALAAAVADLLADPQRRRALALAGRARYEERFRVETMIDGFMARYRAVRG